MIGMLLGQRQMITGRVTRNSYIQALSGYAANHVYEYDKFHLDRCGIVVLIMPTGKSGHLEFGYAIGRGKKGYIVLDDPGRWDIMYRFADKVFTSVDDLRLYLEKCVV